MWELLIKTAGSILGSETKTGENQLLELFKGSAQKEREFKLALEEKYQAKLEMELKDRMDARNMQVAALKQSDIFSKRFLYYLTIGLLGVTGLLALFPLFFQVPPGNEAMITRATDFFYMVSGGSIIGFFFGKNSKREENGK